jgi:hypothetical protein
MVRYSAAHWPPPKAALLGSSGPASSSVVNRGSAVSFAAHDGRLEDPVGHVCPLSDEQADGGRPHLARRGVVADRLRAVGVVDIEVATGERDGCGQRDNRPGV